MGATIIKRSESQGPSAVAATENRGLSPINRSLSPIIYYELAIDSPKAYISLMDFEWDDIKSEACFQKRGFDFAYAAKAFTEPSKPMIGAITAKSAFG